MTSNSSESTSKLHEDAYRSPPVLASYRTIGFSFEAVEAIVITAGSVLGQIAYGRLAGSAPDDLWTSIGVGLVSSVLYVSLARSAGLYRLPTLVTPGDHLNRIAGVCCVALLLLTAVFFLLKIGSHYSRGALVGFAAFMVLLCGLSRFAAAAAIEMMLSHGMVAGRAAFLIGDQDELTSLSSAYLLRHFGLREVGRLPLETATANWTESLERAMNAAREGRAREFVVVTKLNSLELIDRLQESLRVSPLAVKLVPNRTLRSLIGFQAAGLWEPRDHIIELQRAPMGALEQIIKRCFDIAIACVTLVVLMPVILLAALAIKIDSPGPIIFMQNRNGFNQHPFTIFKFRSMAVLENGSRIVQAKRGDHRVTRVGRILRKTSIDELPQLVNVLRGEMSLVGPRPHAIAHDVEYKSIIGDYCMRHHVKPGITGWAQVNGCRGETVHPEAMQKRVDLDIWYVNNRSTMLDMRILLRTCFEVFGLEAY